MSPGDKFIAYPASAESFWVGEAERVMERSGEEALEKLTSAVAHLSDLFTTERPAKQFPDYFADPRLLAAYGVFFLPQSFTRTSFALTQICGHRGWKPASPNPRILDVGSGPGSCGVAVAHRLSQMGYTGISLTGLDKSPMALVAMESFGQAVLGEAGTVATRIGDAARSETWPEGTFDVIVAGFVLNELPQLDDLALVRWYDAVRSRLAPGGLVLVLEPALRITSQRLQRLSDTLAQRGDQRIAPELDARPDPQLGSGEHWSHETRAWTAPASTEFVNRHLHRDLREVRFTFAAMSEADLAPLPTGLARLISDVQIIKGLLRFVALRAGRIENVEVPTRGLSKHEVKQLAATFARGDIVRYPEAASPRLRLAKHEDLRVVWTPQGYFAQ